MTRLETESDVRDRMIELSGVDGQGGVIAKLQETQASSATSQGTRIGKNESDIDTLRRDVDDLKRFKRALIMLASLAVAAGSFLGKALLDRLLD